ncbi:MAG: PEP-CTERM sorting domain-containing protein [Akkermansiaceae bacterium]
MPLISHSSNAAITIAFSESFSSTGGIATNFANAAGTAANGLTWGIIVDNSGDGFLAAYDISGSGTSAQIQGGDDKLYISAQTTSDTTGQSEFSPTFVPEGFGGAGSLTAVSFNSPHAANTPFAIVWFDSSAAFDDASSSTAGILTNSDVTGTPFLIPSDDPPGGTFAISAWARGDDPVRSATGLNITFVPEPSSTALIGLGGLALLLRRRR